MIRRRRFYGGLALFFLLTVLVSGCTTKSAARAQAQQAYLAGRNAALQQRLNANDVTIIGPVQNPQVPWIAGLTLAQAIATANYVGTLPPSQIIITHAGESATLDAASLLKGADIPLEPGDVVELR